MKKLVLSLLIFVPIIIFGQIINIPADYPTIQEGVDAANEGDTVLVHPGLYLEHLIIDNKNITLSSLFLTTQNASYIAQTIIDGDTSGTVMHMKNLNQDTRLTGLTIRNGKNIDENGGGLIIESASPLISDMVISNNTALNGGGIYCSNSSLHLNNVSMFANAVVARGGGIKADNSDLFMDNCLLTDNHGNIASAMHYFVDSEDNILFTIHINSCEISDNVASGQTPGLLIIRFGGNSLFNATIDNCDFLNNIGGGNGALQIRGEDVFFVMKNCKFLGNNVTNYTAAAAFLQNCSGEVYNCLVASNHGSTGGGNWNTGGFCLWGGVEVSFMNCVFAENLAGYGAGLTVGPESIAYVTNSIFWGNVNQQIAVVDYEESGGSLYMDYNDIQYGIDSIRVDPFSELVWGDHNVVGDPLFVGAGDDEYALSSGSPCIDGGTPDTTGISILPYDILGNVRIWDGDGNGSAIIDMGAYEFDAPVWVGITDPPINEIDSKMITTLYPNPCSGTFHIKFILPVNESVSCEVYSISGQKVWQKNVCSQGANILKIDLSDFPSGIYLLQISSNSNTDRAKIILK